MENQGVPRVLVFVLLGVISLFIFGSQMFITVAPGENGVLFKRFGGGLDKEVVYGQGFHVFAPWNKMIVYETRVLENFENMNVICSDGLEVGVEFSARYFIDMNQLGYLHDELGEQYLTKVIKPELRAAAKIVIGKYIPKDLYADKRDSIAQEIFDATELRLKEKHIILDAVLISNITLPAELVAKIEGKLKRKEQIEIEQYEQQIIKIQAANRILEAEGKATANKALNSSLTDNILKHKAIETTGKLIESTNSKVFVIGNGDGDLPIILGGQ